MMLDIVCEKSHRIIKPTEAFEREALKHPEMIQELVNAVEPGHLYFIRDGRKPKKATGQSPNAS